MAQYIPVALFGAQQFMADQRDRATAKQQAMQAQSQTDSLLRQQSRADAARADATRKLLASRRAGMAGSGVTADGSGAAVLDGLRADSAAEGEAEREETVANVRAIGQNLNLSQRINLLQARQRDWNRYAGLLRD
jgi:hypothetical protein